MFLANEFIERARPHAGGEWRGFIHRGKIDILLLKQLLHAETLRREKTHFQLSR